MKNTKKCLTLVAALMMAVAANAQVFILSEEEFTNNERTQAPPSGPFVPYQGGDFDQTLPAPLGSGWLLMASLGGAYLLAKRRKED